MNEILKEKFNSLNSEEQTRLICELLKENNFIDFEKIMKVLFEQTKLSTIEKVYDDFIADIIY